MYVTTTNYKNHSLVRKSTNEPPIFAGPLYIHSYGLFDSYFPFFSHLSMKLQKQENLKIGSDDEAALVNAIEAAFNSVTLVKCTKHLKGNTIIFSSEINILICI